MSPHPTFPACHTTLARQIVMLPAVHAQQPPHLLQVSAAQKRLERLQLNSGLATSNDYMQSSRPSSASMTAGANRTGSLGQSFDRNGSVGSPGGLRSSIGGPLGTILADRGSIGSGRSTGAHQMPRHDHRGMQPQCTHVCVRQRPIACRWQAQCRSSQSNLLHTRADRLLCRQQACTSVHITRARLTKHHCANDLSSDRSPSPPLPPPESAGGASPMQRNTGSSGGAWSASEPSNLRSSSEARTMSSAAAAAAGVAQQHSPPITAFSDEHIRRSSSSSQGQAPQQHQAQALSHLRVQQLQQQGSGITVSRSGSEVEDMDADEVLPIDSGTPRSPIVPVMVDTSDMRRFLMAPGPREGPVQCYILRDKGSSRMYPRWGDLLLWRCCCKTAGRSCARAQLQDVPQLGGLACCSEVPLLWGMGIHGCGCRSLKRACQACTAVLSSHAQLPAACLLPYCVADAATDMHITAQLPPCSRR